jgi:long-chain fatty acid transport protein
MKQRMMKFSIVLAVLAVFVMSHALYATNGYFSHGYGIKYKSLAGAGVALSLGTMGSATNPAGIVFVGNRFDFSLAMFNPNRQYMVTGAPSGFPGTFGLAPGTVESDSKWFVIPAIGANWMLNDNSAFGLAMYGNGGMNTNYATRTFGFSPTGVDLSQLFVAPSYAKKFGAHAFGVTAILAYQRFQAEGLTAFSNFSSDAANLTNKDYDNAFGYGGRIGYQGEWLKNFFVGASYQIKTKMSKFDNYAGLFAEDGCFDIPSNWTAGLAYKPTSALTLVFDVQQIFYSDCKAANNSLLPNLMTSKLGDENGAGFGWEDMTVFKGGVQWQANKDWTLRAGYSNGKQPIPLSEVLFNILAPGVIEQHATFGFSKTLKNNHEISFAAMHGFSKSITGANPLEAPGQQTIELKMNQWEFEIGYSF